MRTRTLNVLAAIAHVALLTAVTFAQESETSARVRALNNAVVDLHAKLQTASSADRANLRLQAASILEERAVELATLIQHQPAEALSVAFTPELLEDLRTSFPELAPRFESRDTWEGPIEYVIMDNPAFGRSQSATHMSVGTEQLAIHFAGSEPGGLRSGMRLHVSGVRSLGDVAAAGGFVADASTTGPTLACSTMGTQKVAVLLVTFPGVPAPSISPTAVYDVFFGSSGRSLNGFLQEASYGQTSATGDVFGWYTLDAPYTCDQYSEMRDAAVRAADPYVNFLNYGRVVVIFPDPGGCTWSGLGTLGCSSMTSADGSFTASTAWGLSSYLSTTDQAVGLFAHEMGHNLGLQHGRSRDFGADAVGPLGSAGSLFEYGDQFSVMGSSSLGLYSADHKATLGWLISGTNYKSVQSSGSFTLQPTETNPPGLQALKIQRGSGNPAWLWVEYRQPMGNYDSTVVQPFGSGALIHYQDAVTGTDYSDLLDFTPATSSWADPALPAGVTWVDPYSNLSLSVSSSTTSALTVNVNYGAASCTAVNPSVVLSPSGQSALAGSVATYTITITNNNSSVCSASAYSLSAGVPAWWTATLASSSLMIGPGLSASTTMTVEPPSGTVSSTYILSVTAANATYSGVGTGSLTVTGGSCAAASPTVSVSPATQSVPAGGTITYTVAVTNNSTSNCGAATYTLSAGAPSGWTATLATSSLSVAPASSAATTLSLTTAGTAAGTYAVTTKAVSGAYAATGSASVSVGASCTVANPNLTLSPPNPSTGAGANVSYTATLTNLDSSGCPVATFSFGTSAPSGWSSSLSATSITLAPGQSATVTMTKSVPVGTAAGKYAVNGIASRGAISTVGAASCTVLSALATALALPGGSTYAVRSTITATANVQAGGAPVARASVTFTITRPGGGTATGTAITASNGIATWVYKATQKGAYAIAATAISGSQTAASNTLTFNVK